MKHVEKIELWFDTKSTHEDHIKRPAAANEGDCYAYITYQNRDIGEAHIIEMSLAKCIRYWRRFRWWSFGRDAKLMSYLATSSPVLTLTRRQHG